MSYDDFINNQYPDKIFGLSMAEFLKTNAFSFYANERSKFVRQQEEEEIIKRNKASIAKFQAFYDAVTGREDEEDEDLF